MFILVPLLPRKKFHIKNQPFDCKKKESKGVADADETARNKEEQGMNGIYDENDRTV